MPASRYPEAGCECHTTGPHHPQKPLLGLFQAVSVALTRGEESGPLQEAVRCLVGQRGGKVHVVHAVQRCLLPLVAVQRDLDVHEAGPRRVLMKAEPAA